MKIDKCKKVRKLLFEYNRSELDPERHKSIHVHLKGCQGCSTYFKEAGSLLNPITYQRERNCPDVTSGLSLKGIAEDFWSNYDIKLFERLERTRRRIFFQLELPRLRPLIKEALAGLVVLFVLFILVEKGFLGYDLKTYIYLLKQVW